MTPTTDGEGTEDVNDFLLRIRELGEKRDKEDEERTKKLEEEILQGRRERQARRAERARSISPTKDSPPLLDAARLSVSSSVSQRAIEPPEQLEPTCYVPDSSAKPDFFRDDESITTDGSRRGSRVDLNDIESSPKPLSTSPLRSRTGTLSWQQRPSSRDLNTNRPFFSTSPSRENRWRAMSTTSNDDHGLSRSPTARSPSARDAPSQNQADQGTRSPSRMTNAEEDLHETSHDTSPKQTKVDDESNVGSEKENSHHDAAEERSRSPSRASSIFADSSLGNRYSSVSSVSTATGLGSPMPLSSAQKLEPRKTEPSSEDQATSPISPRRLSPERSRSTSPTKGLGGFVQSAMMKRSDSVSKRWSAQLPSGLSRGNSIASNRNSVAAPSNNESSLGSPTSRFNREVPSLSAQRPGSSHSEATVVHNLKDGERPATPPVPGTRPEESPSRPPLSLHTRTGSVFGNEQSPTPSLSATNANTRPSESPTRPSFPLGAKSALGNERPSTPPGPGSPGRPSLSLHARSASTLGNEQSSDAGSLPPTSPAVSRTMDPRRWSPTKSTWLESALNRPDAPRHKKQPSQQASWAKDRQTRASVDLGRKNSFKEVTPIGLMRTTAPGSHSKSSSISGIPDLLSAQETPKVKEEPGESEAPDAKDSNPQTPAEKPSEPPAEKTSEPSTEAETKPENTEADITQRKRAPSLLNPTKTNLESPLSSPRDPLLNRPKPQSPVVDFRANLRKREVVKDQPKGPAPQNEPEFKNIFGRLRKAEASTYVAPDALKDNIMKGKAALNTTGGPRQSQRTDELKDSILKQKEAMKAGGGSVRRNTAGEMDAPGNFVPEAIAKRNNLTKSSSAKSDLSSGTLSPLSPKELGSPQGSQYPLGSPLSSQEQGQPIDPLSPRNFPEEEKRDGAHDVQNTTTDPEALNSEMNDKSTPDVVGEQLNKEVPEEENQTKANEEAIKPVRALPSDNAAQVADAPAAVEGLATKGKLAGRINPALAGLLSRGPPTSDPAPSNSLTQNGVQSSDSMPAAPLTHMTKGRARGPIRRLPKVIASEATDSTSESEKKLQEMISSFETQGSDATGPVPAEESKPQETPEPFDIKGMDDIDSTPEGENKLQELPLSFKPKETEAVDVASLEESKPQLSPSLDSKELDASDSAPVVLPSFDIKEPIDSYTSENQPQETQLSSEPKKVEPTSLVPEEESHPQLPPSLASKDSDVSDTDTDTDSDSDLEPSFDMKKPIDSLLSESQPHETPLSFEPEKVEPTGRVPEESHTQFPSSLNKGLDVSDSDSDSDSDSSLILYPAKENHSHQMPLSSEPKRTEGTDTALKDENEPQLPQSSASKELEFNDADSDSGSVSSFSPSFDIEDSMDSHPVKDNKFHEIQLSFEPKKSEATSLVPEDEDKSQVPQSLGSKEPEAYNSDLDSDSSIDTTPAKDTQLHEMPLPSEHKKTETINTVPTDESKIQIPPSLGSNEPEANDSDSDSDSSLVLYPERKDHSHEMPLSSEPKKTEATDTAPKDENKSQILPSLGSKELEAYDSDSDSVSSIDSNPVKEAQPHEMLSSELKKSEIIGTASVEESNPHLSPSDINESKAIDSHPAGESQTQEMPFSFEAKKPEAIAPEESKLPLSSFNFKELDATDSAPLASPSFDTKSIDSHPAGENQLQETPMSVETKKPEATPSEENTLQLSSFDFKGLDVTDSHSLTSPSSDIQKPDHFDSYAAEDSEIKEAPLSFQTKKAENVDSLPVETKPQLSSFESKDVDSDDSASLASPSFGAKESGLTSTIPEKETKEQLSSSFGDNELDATHSDSVVPPSGETKESDAAHTAPVDESKPQFTPFGSKDSDFMYDSDSTDSVEESRPRASPFDHKEVGPIESSPGDPSHIETKESDAAYPAPVEESKPHPLPFESKDLESMYDSDSTDSGEQIKHQSSPFDFEAVRATESTPVAVAPIGTKELEATSPTLVEESKPHFPPFESKDSESMYDSDSTDSVEDRKSQLSPSVDYKAVNATESTPITPAAIETKKLEATGPTPTESNPETSHSGIKDSDSLYDSDSTDSVEEIKPQETFPSSSNIKTSDPADSTPVEGRKSLETLSPSFYIHNSEASGTAPVQGNKPQLSPFGAKESEYSYDPDSTDSVEERKPQETLPSSSYIHKPEASGTAPVQESSFQSSPFGAKESEYSYDSDSADPVERLKPQEILPSSSYIHKPEANGTAPVHETNPQLSPFGAKESEYSYDSDSADSVEQMTPHEKPSSPYISQPESSGTAAVQDSKPQSSPFGAKESEYSYDSDSTDSVERFNPLEILSPSFYVREPEPTNSAPVEESKPRSDLNANDSLPADGHNPQETSSLSFDTKESTFPKEVTPRETNSPSFNGKGLDLNSSAPVEGRKSLETLSPSFYVRESDAIESGPAEEISSPSLDTKEPALMDGRRSLEKLSPSFYVKESDASDSAGMENKHQETPSPVFDAKEAEATQPVQMEGRRSLEIHSPAFDSKEADVTGSTPTEESKPQGIPSPTFDGKHAEATQPAHLPAFAFKETDTAGSVPVKESEGQDTPLSASDIQKVETTTPTPVKESEVQETPSSASDHQELEITKTAPVEGRKSLETLSPSFYVKESDPIDSTTVEEGRSSEMPSLKFDFNEPHTTGSTAEAEAKPQDIPSPTFDIKKVDDTNSTPVEDNRSPETPLSTFDFKEPDTAESTPVMESNPQNMPLNFGFKQSEAANSTPAVANDPHENPLSSFDFKTSAPVEETSPPETPLSTFEFKESKASPSSSEHTTGGSIGWPLTDSNVSQNVASDTSPAPSATSKPVEFQRSISRMTERDSKQKIEGLSPNPSPELVDRPRISERRQSDDVASLGDSPSRRPIPPSKSPASPSTSIFSLSRSSQIQYASPSPSPLRSSFKENQIQASPAYQRASGLRPSWSKESSPRDKALPSPPVPPKFSISTDRSSSRRSTASLVPQADESWEAISAFFKSLPNSKDSVNIDPQVMLTDKNDEPKIRTLKMQMWEMTGDGKRQDLPVNQEYILYEGSMYLCVHLFEINGGVRSEAHLWCGDDVPDAAIDDAQTFSRKVAKENGCKLEVIKQGKETARFIQALGGILITRRGSNSRSSSSAIFMLCGRKHMGQMVFDEVNFSQRNLCTGYPFVISAMFGKLYLWKGKGSVAEEIGAARLIGMDLGLTGEFEEVAEGEEPESFFEVFPPYSETGDYMSSDFWRLKPNHDRFRLRLMRVEHELGQRFPGFWLRRSGSASPVIRPNDTVQEIEPFSQKDVTAKGIFILDTFFEIYVIVGEDASHRRAEFASAVVFAHEYGILAASLQDRPFIPKSYISLGGLPDSCRSAFRKWEPRSPQASRPQVFPLNAAIDAIRN